jgi:hypothetical protein
MVGWGWGVLAVDVKRAREDIAETLVTTFWCMCGLSFPYAGPYLQRNKVTKRL